MDDPENLKAQLAQMKMQLEASQLREKLQESELRAERLEKENLRLHHASVDSQRRETNASKTTKSAPLIEVPDLDETELDESFEIMMVECLHDEQKRDSLRATYYKCPSPTEKYYFFLEWASYLRKPEVLQQNSKKATGLDIYPPGESTDGMRQRNATRQQSNSPTTQMEAGFDRNDIIPNGVDVNGKYRGYKRPDFQPKEQYGWIMQLIFYVILVSSIAGILWLIKGFVQNGMHQHEEREELYN